MTSARALAASVLGLRVAYGAALVVAPERLSRRWLGDVAGRAGGRVALRALGARELALHAAALDALRRGAPLRPWLAASVAGDLSDVAATAAARTGLPDGAATATAAIGGGSALLTAVVAAVVDG